MLIEFLQTDFDFKDERGSLIQLVHKDWNQVNYITSLAGTIRGNHYHKVNQEAFFVIDGSFKLKLTHIKTNENDEYIIEAGTFFKIMPDVSHSFEFLTNTQLISLYDKGVEQGEIMDIYTN